MSSYSKGGEMSINLIVGNEEAKKAITNQLRMKKSSGTYLLYGKKGADLLEFALAFAKGLNCEELEFDYRDWETDRKSTRLNSSHITRSRMPSSA